VTDDITKGEREELRRVVRGDFKALRLEIGVRRAELLADIERAIAMRFRANEDAIAAADLEITGIVREANARISRVLETAARSADGYELRWQPLATPLLRWERQQRDELRRAMIADLDARIIAAQATMARQENNLLKELSTGALSSPSATAFLERIPTVAALVPESRLAELEEAFASAPISPEDRDRAALTASFMPPPALDDEDEAADGDDDEDEDDR